MKIYVAHDYRKQPKPRSTAPKLIRNGLTSAFVMLVLALLVGAGYTYYTGLHNKKTVNNQLAVDTTLQHRVLTPTAPDPNAAVGVAIQLVTSPIARGESASVSIKTYPGASCDIKILYNNIPTTETGLKDKIADIYGVINWDWTISSNAPEGTSPIHVTC